MSDCSGILTDPVRVLRLSVLFLICRRGCGTRARVRNAISQHVCERVRRALSDQQCHGVQDQHGQQHAVI